MKHLLLSLLFLLITACLFSQAVDKITYQAVVRDAENHLVTDRGVGIRISILQGDANGPRVFREIFNPNPLTNSNGLLTLEIGGGIAIEGKLSDINWADGPYILQVESDPAGGTDYSVSGVSQILSVPYALYAQEAEKVRNLSLSDLSDIDITGAETGQVLKWNGTEWKPSNDNTGGGSGPTYLPGQGITIDAGNVISNVGDLSNNNELQTLSLSGSSLTLSQGGGSVTLPVGSIYVAGTGIQISGNVISNTGDNDNNPVNELQSLSLNGQNLSLSNGGGSVNLSGIGDQWGTQSVLTGSELNGNGTPAAPLRLAPQNAAPGQILKWNGTIWTPANDNTGGSSGPTYIPGSGIAIDANNVISNTGDLSNNNEIQTLSLNGSNISLSNGGGSVALPDPSPTNEIQTLSLSGQNLALSNGGGSVTLPTGTTYTAGMGISITGNVINNTGDTDNSVTNEIQSISLSGSNISLSNGGGSIALPDPSSTNEIQTLSLSGQNLALSNGGGSVTLPAGTTYTAGTGINISGNVISNLGDTDNSITNEIQTLSLSGSNINLSNGGGSIALPDPSNTNEIQILSLSGQNLALSNGGGSVTLPTGTTYTAGPGISLAGDVISNTGDNDNSPTNEIQTLSLSGQNLSLSNGGGSVALPGGSLNGENGYLVKFNSPTTGNQSGIFQDSDGKIGIGTTSPIFPVHVFKGTGSAFLGEVLSAGTGVTGKATSGTGVQGNSETGSAVVGFASGSGTGVRALSSSGIALIAESPNGNGISVVLNNNNSNAIYASKGKVIFDEGSVGIGVLSPGFRLHLSVNSAAKPTSSAWTVPSDARLKKDVIRYAGGLAEVMEINPVRFTYTGAAGMPQETGIGIIAQELQRIAPYMVHPWTYKQNEEANAEEYLGVDNGPMTYMLINAVKEQQEMIVQLQKERDEQKKSIITLTTQLQQEKEEQKKINAVLLEQISALQTAMLSRSDSKAGINRHLNSTTALEK